MDPFIENIEAFKGIGKYLLLANRVRPVDTG
jgi:hypothetical protein